MTIVAHDVDSIGGMELQLRELIAGLLEAGDAVTLISRTCVMPSHPGFSWIRVPGPRRPFSIGYPWFFLAGSLLVALRRRGVVHATGAIVFNTTDLTTVHYCHHAAAELPRFRRGSRSGLAYRLNARVAASMSRWAERWCYRPRRTRALVAVSAGVVGELRRHFPAMADRTHAIPNGVDTRRFQPAARTESSGLSALFVGGEWERKGLNYAIEAVAGLPGWRLVVVGSGDVPRYRRLASELEAAQRVVFVGATTDVADHYRAADAFVLPTAYETFSLVTYEAAASGLPLLVTPVNGVVDLLRDGVNGWFVDRDAGQIRGRLRQLETDRELRWRMGVAAREDSIAFSWTRMVDRYRSLYRAVAR